jgi:hypothetical protein
LQRKKCLAICRAQQSALGVVQIGVSFGAFWGLRLGF